MNIQKALDELKKHYHQEIVKGGLYHLDDLHCQFMETGDIFSDEAEEILEEIRWHERELQELGVSWVLHKHH